MKKNNNKGFTLAELLIVVAIIAVLTAIAIPVFTAQLHKSRDAADKANCRSLYAELQADYLTWDGNDSDYVAQTGTGNYQFNGDATVSFTAGEGYTVTWTCETSEHTETWEPGSAISGGSTST